jgi:hypothetical protein
MPNGTPEQHSIFNDGWHAAKEPTLDERLRCVWEEVLRTTGYHPYVAFCHDDDEVFPDGYWAITEFESNLDLTGERVFRGITLHAAIKRAEEALFTPSATPAPSQ